VNNKRRMTIKGRPKVINGDGWLEGAQRLAAVEKDGFLLFEMKVTSAMEPESFKSMMSLGGDTCEGMRFEIEQDGDSVRLWFRHVIRDDMYDMGIVPKEFTSVLIRGDNWFLFGEHAELIEFGVDKSVAGLEIDRHRVMSLADFDMLEEFTDDEFSQLISSMKGVMSAGVCVTKLRFIMSKFYMVC